MLPLGRWRLAAIQDGTFAVDGGSAFGIVPREAWARICPPDDRNRVRLAIRCLLAVDGGSGRRILVDDGIGEGLEPGLAGRLGVDRSGGGLEAGLARCGLSRADITDVVLTHLHLDHAGGTVRAGAGGRPEIAFPRATVHVQRRAWQWAQAPSEHDRGSFRPECFELLNHSSQLHLVDGELDLFPDFEVIVSEGHTTGQQLPRIRGEGSHLTCCGDLIPTAAHLRPAWGMAFDLRPLTAIEEKKVLLAEALEDDGILFLAHDPELAACRLQEREGHPVFREKVAL
jgi:glyoxylase-like metal-dependent hydrolase (beta-lactamase superfamily II)